MAMEKQADEKYRLWGEGGSYDRLQPFCGKANIAASDSLGVKGLTTARHHSRFSTFALVATNRR